MEIGFHSYSELRENLVTYLQDLPFQIYASLTHHGTKSVEYADFLCKSWLERLERHHRAPVGAVRSLELGTTRRHPHHHLLLLCKTRIDLIYAEESWMLTSGNASRHSAKIERYDPEKGALWYVLKQHGSEFCEIELRKIEYFRPTPGNFWTRDARRRRQRRRHVDRREDFPI